MKCYRDLFKKKKIKTMNIKMVINTQISTTESKKQTKQKRRTETEQWMWRDFDGCQMEGDVGEWVKR